ncbi:MAG: hypothetical protein M1821_006943 [Bathelium mastoideum]|nr:MAG: hypothetical protein M1821_006943 [Bathelium mastoideum]
MMAQLLPAKPFDPSGKFFVIRDQENNPMIFSRGNDGQLYLIFRGMTGNNEMIELGKRFGIELPSRITALNVTQDQDLTTYIAFASGSKENESILHVVRPIKPQDVNWSGDGSLDHLLYEGDRMPIAVQDILIGTNDDRPTNSPYPFVAVTFNQLYAETKDVWRIQITESKWEFMKDLQLPVNAPEVRSICVGTYRSFRGLFFLWKGDRIHLDFTGLDPASEDPVLQNIELDVPPGANCLASFPNQAGYSELLVGGDGLYHYSAGSAVRGTGYTRLDKPDEDLFKGVRQLAVSIVESQASVWGLNQLNTLAYQEFTLVDGAPRTLGKPAIPLMSYDQGAGRFAALRQARKGQSIFVVGSDDQLRQIEHDFETKAWRTSDIKIPTLAKNFEINSYTVRASITDANSLPIHNQEVWLFASSPVSAIVNGFGVRLDQIGALVKTDYAGAITIIMETNDISAPLITIQGYKSNPDLNGVTYQIDPLGKLNKALAEVNTGADLRKIQLEGGENLVDPNQSDAELDGALKALKDLKNVANGLPEAKNNNQFNTTSKVVGAAVSPSGTDWGFFHWVGDKIKHAAQWAVKQLKEGWAFVVTIGKRVFNFLLNTITQIGKAIWKVLETIGASIKKLVKFIGFLFEWDDIVATHNLIVNFTNCGILWGLDSIDSLKEKAGQFLEELKAKAASFDPAKAGNLIGDGKIGKDSAKSKGGKDKEAAMMESELKSPGANFGTYQTDHGGVALNKKDKKQAKSSGVVQALWDMCKGVMKKVAKLISTFGSDFITLLTDSDRPIGDLLKSMGSHLMVNAIEILEEIVNGIFELLGQIILKLALLVNEEIKIPVLSALYKNISGNELTVLDAVALILAIPITIVYKLVKNESPRKAPGIEKYMEPNLYNRALIERVASDNGITSSSQAPHIQTFAMQSSNLQIFESKTTLQAQTFGKQTSPPADKVLTSTKAAEESYWGNLFDEICSAGSTIWSFAKPVAGALWFLVKTIPGWFDPTAAVAKTSIVFKWVLWIMSVPYQFSRPGNGWRIAGWLVGVINPIVGHVPEKFIQAGYEAFVCLVQCFMLAPTYSAIEDAVGAVRVDNLFKIGEFTTVIGKFCSALAGQSLGANVGASLLAIVLTNGGFGMVFAHAVEMKDGKKAEAGSIDMLT